MDVKIGNSRAIVQFARAILATKFVKLVETVEAVEMMIIH
jgi:hypothetical protein